MLTGGQALGWLMWVILGFGCVYAVRSRGIQLPGHKAFTHLPMSVQSIWLGMLLGKLLHDIKSKAIWLLNGIKSGKSGIMRCSHAGKSQLLEATSASLNARLGLAHATSEAHALASSSSVDQQPNTIWEVQLAKGDHSPSQQLPSYAVELSAARFLDIERSTDNWDEVPDSARMRADQAESALKQAQAQAEEEAGEQAQRSISLAAEAVREADLELQPAAQVLKMAAAQKREAKQRADGSWPADALKAALTRAEQAENALQEQQLKMAAREQEAEQSVAERAASMALDRAAQAEAVVQLQAAKAEVERAMMSKAHEAEKVTEAAVQRAEVAEGALRRVDAVEHKIAKLRRVLKKWSVLQKKVSVCVTVCHLAQLGPNLLLPPLVLPCPASPGVALPCSAQLCSALCSLLLYTVTFACPVLPKLVLHGVHSAKTSCNALRSITVLTLNLLVVWIFTQSNLHVVLSSSQQH